MIRILSLLLAGVVLFAGCGGSGEEGEPVARIGDKVITDEMLKRRVAEMPPQTQARFEGEEGRQFVRRAYEEGWKGLIARCPDNGPVLRRYLATKS